MAIVAPEGRQHFSADALCQVVRTSVANLPDHRAAEAEMPVADALRSACALFALTSPARLALAKHRAEGPLRTVYRIGCVPGETPRRERLEPVSPASLRPVCKSVLRQLPRGNAREPMACLAGHDVVALEGTGSVSSTTMPWAACRQQVHRNGTITDAHQLVGAAIIPPDVRAVSLLMPAAMVPPDGTTTHDGARQAAQRLVAKRRQDHPQLTCISTEDRLSSHAPHLQTLQDHHLHAILGVNKGDHPLLFHQVQAAEPTGHVTADARHDRAAGLVHRFRVVNQVPLHASQADVRGNVLAYWASGADQVQHCSWVTDLRVNKRPVLHLMRGGRARWKIDHEPCHTLNNQGDHCEHHDGHGTTHRSVVFAMVMLLAFLVDQTPQRCCALCRAVWAKMGSKRHVWERLRSVFSDDRLDSRRALCEALFDGLEKPRPLLTLDAS